MSSPTGEATPRLLAWFLSHRRELAWRGESDPYRIWVSEVMLQQTTAAAASTYYRRWLTLFPTVESLAGAPLERVLKAWEGLGYYGRARNLHRAAGMIVERYGGRFPDTTAEALKLPGVGEYTCAAVLSIAYAQALPAVDGNVLRVISRLTACPAPGAEDRRRTAARLRRLRRYAGERVEASFLHYHPGWVNQAWMELGALVCRPEPRCPACPLVHLCRAHRLGRVREFPPSERARPLPIRHHLLLLLVPPSRPAGFTAELARLTGRPPAPEHFGRLLLRWGVPLLLVKRAEEGLLGGLWELPNVPVTAGQSGNGKAGAGRVAGIDMLADTGQEIKHRYSHFEVRFRPWLAAATERRPLGPRLGPWTEQRWVQPADSAALAALPRPSAHIRALRLFGLIEV